MGLLEVVADDLLILEDAVAEELLEPVGELLVQARAPPLAEELSDMQRRVAKGFGIGTQRRLERASRLAARARRRRAS